jgi:hypothetical protein
MIGVSWTWGGNPSPDFTVKVYSKFSGVNILDSSSKNNVLHYNGSSPSGFINSTYVGMTKNCSLYINYSNTPDVEITYAQINPVLTDVDWLNGRYA